jgi:hypothetical protein
MKSILILLKTAAAAVVNIADEFTITNENYDSNSQNNPTKDNPTKDDSSL